MARLDALTGREHRPQKFTRVGLRRVTPAEAAPRTLASEGRV